MKFLRNTWRAIKGFFPWYAHLYKGRPWYTKTAVGIVSTIVAFFLYLGMVDVNFLWLFGKSPGFMEIQAMIGPTSAGRVRDLQLGRQTYR